MAGRQTITKAEREARLLIVAEMLCRRIPQTQIAREVGVHPSQITYDKRILLGRWMEESMSDIGEMIAEDLRGIRHAEEVAWRQYQLSCGEQSTTTQTIEDTGESSPAAKRSRTVKSEQGTGDTRILQVLINLREQRMKLLGIAGNTNVLINLGSQQATVDAPPSAQSHAEWLQQNTEMEEATGVGLSSAPPEFAEFSDVPEPGGNGQHDDGHDASRNGK